jgi:hypothetical protein
MYRIWTNMIQRCTNENIPHFDDYGGRGIQVCERWASSYKAFAQDMGDCPKGMSLERIDNSGPYSPLNCRWATLMEQGQNKRNNRRIKAFGVELCMSEWSRRTGLYEATIHKRLARGWSPEMAVTP